ncbi:MAG TPA: anti-sigma factor [Solirubrobacteraceae bacterium]|nr:anti-sigma factor [Solirubrobacteraceae bacterium]
MSIDEPHIEDGHACAGNAAPYVLGALSDEEHRAFQTHLESCSVCREEVDALQVVASALPSAVPQLSAPPQLKRRLMASVREDARRRTAREARREPAEWRRRAASWLHGRQTLVAALAAAAVVLAVVALVSGSGGSATTRVVRAQVLPARASASLSIDGRQAQLNIAGMPRTAPGRVYEMWIKRSASARPLPTDALFTVDADGAASVGVPGGVRGVREVMVTSEPIGGSRVPTLPLLIVARVS